MICSVCHQHMEDSHFFFVVLRTHYGYSLVRGCDHNMTLATAALSLGEDKVAGVVTSSTCLAILISNLESRRPTENVQ